MSLALVALLTTGALVSAVSAGDCPAQGSCLAIHPTPGCDDADCCSIVCAADPLCCEIDWDIDCVIAAEQTCIGLCGAAVNGSCFVPQNTPSCDDEACCETICGFDPFCCDVRWDFSCSIFAQFNCDPPNPGTCGDPAAGSCFQPQPNSACNDLACCEGVCQVDPTCCALVWDVLCASIATQICASGCVPLCPPSAVVETEPCGENKNDPCYAPSANPVLQTVACGQTACGRIRVTTGPLTHDIDVWRIVLVDGDGDGLVGAQLSFSSSFKGFACIVPAETGRQGCVPLASAVAVVNTQLCIEALGPVVCLPPGEYRIVVAPGTWPVLGATPIACNDGDRYTVRLLCAEAPCAPACGAAGSCFFVSKGPGCEDVECCEAVCAVDPDCCVVQWDALCVDQAIKLCAETPVNDDCAGAIDIGTGSHPFATFGASDGVATGACPAKSAIADLWYRFVPRVDSILTVSTCGGQLGFDSAISVYAGGCEAPILLACNDDGGGPCLPTTASQVSIPVDCGMSYLIRVGGGRGEGTLTVSIASGPPCSVPCVGDLDGDASVGPADLAILLGAWGGGGPADLSGNGSVGPEDLALLLGAWGPC
jgi:hypothetical protein